MRPATGEPRERSARTLWRLAVRHAEEPGSLPIEIAQRSIQRLARP